MTAKKPRTVKTANSQKLLIRKFNAEFPFYRFLFGMLLLVLSWFCSLASESQNRLGESLEYMLWSVGLFVSAVIYLVYTGFIYYFRKRKAASNNGIKNT